MQNLKINTLFFQIIISIIIVALPFFYLPDPPGNITVTEPLYYKKTIINVAIIMVWINMHSNCLFLVLKKQCYS